VLVVEDVDDDELLEELLDEELLLELELELLEEELLLDEFVVEVLVVVVQAVLESVIVVSICSAASKVQRDSADGPRNPTTARALCSSQAWVVGPAPKRFPEQILKAE
jgi:hypothetical protein